MSDQLEQELLPAGGLIDSLFDSKTESEILTALQQALSKGKMENGERAEAEGKWIRGDNESKDWDHNNTDASSMSLSSQLGYLLTRATSHGYSNCMEFLLKHGADPKAARQHQTTLLHLAVLSQVTAAVTLLLEEKIEDVNSTDSNGMTALALAAQLLDTNSLDLLLGHGAQGLDTIQLPLDSKSDGNEDPDDEDSEGEASDEESYFDDEEKVSLLTYAAHHNNLPMLTTLLKHGLEPQAEEKEGEAVNPLILALRADNTPMAALLLSHGATVNPDNYRRFFPLAEAAAYGGPSAIELLLSHGAAINDFDAEGDSVLRNAMLRKDVGIVTLLLDRGAEPEPDAFNAVCGTEWLEGAEILLQRAGAGKAGDALQTASARGKLGLVELFIKYGANVNYTRSPHENVLQAAAENGHEQVVAMLLRAGADPNAPAGIDGTPLYRAAKHGFDGTVRLLLESGAQVDVRTGVCGSALQVAAAGGQKDVVEMLLRAGADVNRQGGDYHSALNAATVFGHKDVMRILVEHGAKS